MNKAHIKAIYLLGITACSLTLSTHSLYAKDLEQNGSIKVSKFNKKEHSNLAKVTLQDAVSAATKRVPGKAVEAELEAEDGFLVYEVKIVAQDKKVIEVYVDAGTSAILGIEQENKSFG